MWKITTSTNPNHINVKLQFVEVGNIVTFEDGGVVLIDKIFSADDGNTLLACGTNYQMTLVKE